MARSGHIKWVRVTIAFTLAALAIFLPLRHLKMHRIYKRVAKYKRFAEGPRPTSVAGSSCGDSKATTSHWPPDRAPCARNGQRVQRRAACRPHWCPPPNVTYEYELVSASSALPSVDSPLRAFYKLLVCYNWYLLAKHLIVCCLRLDRLAHLRYLDCYLVGRFIVNGRVIELASYCACFLLTSILCWYHSIGEKLGATFKMPCFEFLLASHEEIAQWTRRCNSRRPAADAAAGGEQEQAEEEEKEPVREETEGAEDLTGAEGNANIHRRPGQEDTQVVHSSLFEYHNLFESDGRSRCYGLRPNRTAQAWKRLAKSTLRFYQLFGLLFAFLVIFFMSMLLPVALNQKGFEYNYRYCIHHITTMRIQEARRTESQPPAGSPSAPTEPRLFALIRPSRDESGGALGQVLLFGRPNVTKNFHLSSNMGTDFLQPIQGVVVMNAYHVIRVFFDILDSVVIYFQIAFILACAYHMVQVISNDVVCYCKALNGRLEGLIHVLRGISSINLSVHEDYYYQTDIKYNERLPDRGSAAKTAMVTVAEAAVAAATEVDCRSRWRPTRRGAKLIQRQIFELQAMIADMFVQIDWYNKFISHLHLCLILFWLGYSALVSSWIFIPGNESPKTEWFTLHVFATIYLFLLMYQSSALKAECRRLYMRVVVVMALDESVGSSKATWTSLMKFFTPVPMYCFTIIKSIELSMLFGLKLLAWLFSALIVASSFFTVYSIEN